MASRGSQLVAELARRRTIYNLGRNMPISQVECTKLICDAVRQCPSGFNAQGTRLMVLYGEEHKKVWEVLRDAFGKVGMPPEALQQSIHKMETSFLAGAGTVLFYQDFAAVEDLQRKLPLYKDFFPQYADHEHGIALYAVWCALAAAGVGANLQHYAPLMDKGIREIFDVPASWHLLAQMPFGEILESPKEEVPRAPDKDRFVVLGKM